MERKCNMKTTVYTVCDEISKLVSRLYWSYLTGMPLEDAIMKRKFYDTRLLSWALNTDQHLAEAIKTFGIHGEDLSSTRSKNSHKAPFKWMLSCLGLTLNMKARHKIKLCNFLST